MHERNLNFYKSEISESQVLKDLELKKDNYFIVSIHREENVDYKNNLENLLHSLNSVAEKYKLPVIVSTHPRTKNRIEQLKEDIKVNPLINFMKPMGFFDYIKLQQEAKCVISDSGTITEESSILSFPAIMIRKAHERPEGMDEGALIMSGLEKERVLESINVVVSQDKRFTSNIIKDYDVENVSIKVTRVILSYIDYVNRTVWKKDTVNKTF